MKGVGGWVGLIFLCSAIDFKLELSFTLCLVHECHLVGHLHKQVHEATVLTQVIENTNTGLNFLDKL